ncbi:VanZ like family protein [Georgenia satyanarayanai]|uniref:VanZ like family protein n=2 Tax=Georgenia satyanarayanai TaxID=860221 RepID=A0A2Y9AC62_9MICO|nr:VanZ like family protein [Georgenia satyanarayanai]SSA39907.1 VanZ like family protein [Georgenia satyanarayanai]
MTSSRAMTHLRRAVLALALLLHFAALYVPRVPGDGPDLFPGADKVAHVGIFALVVAAALWAGLPARWVVPLALVHAVVSEAVQHVLLPGRSGDPWDALADVVGVALGWAAAALVTRAGRRPSGPGR